MRASTRLREMDGLAPVCLLTLPYPFRDPGARSVQSSVLRWLDPDAISFITRTRPGRTPLNGFKKSGPTCSVCSRTACRSLDLRGIA